MEIEIQGIPQSLRPSYQSRIKASKADLTRYKKLSKELHETKQELAVVKGQLSQLQEENQNLRHRGNHHS